MNALAFISGMPGGSEIILILLIVLLLFGAKKLPELSRSLGKSLGEFKKGKEDLDREMRDLKDEIKGQRAPLDPDVSTDERHDKSKTDPT